MNYATSRFTEADIVRQTLTVTEILFLSALVRIWPDFYGKIRLQEKHRHLIQKWLPEA